MVFAENRLWQKKGREAPLFDRTVFFKGQYGEDMKVSSSWSKGAN